MLCINVLLLRTYTSAVLLVWSFLTTEFFFSPFLSPHSVRIVFFTVNIFDDSHDDACNNARACAMCVCIFSSFFFIHTSSPSLFTNIGFLYRRRRRSIVLLCARRWNAWIRSHRLFGRARATHNNWTTAADATGSRDTRARA